MIVLGYFIMLDVVTIVPDFDFSSRKSGIQPFFLNPAKSGSSHISSWIWRIWQIPVQLQYIELIIDKT